MHKGIVINGHPHAMTLEHRSDAMQRMATTLLRETGVLDTFAQLGTVYPIGSYPLDVMYRPDIDLIVIANDVRRDGAVAVTKHLLDVGHFQTVGFADWASYTSPDAVRGYYWELRAFRGDKWWKLDVWYTTSEADRSIGSSERYARLLREKPAARDVILRVKAHFFDGTKYRDGVTGFAIYDAVLNHGHMTVESFLQAWDAGRSTGDALRTA